MQQTVSFSALSHWCCWLRSHSRLWCLTLSLQCSTGSAHFSSGVGKGGVSILAMLVLNVVVAHYTHLQHFHTTGCGTEHLKSLVVLNSKDSRIIRISFRMNRQHQTNNLKFARQTPFQECKGSIIRSLGYTVLFRRAYNSYSIGHTLIHAEHI